MHRLVGALPAQTLMSVRCIGPVGVVIVVLVSIPMSLVGGNRCPWVPRVGGTWRLGGWRMRLRRRRINDVVTGMDLLVMATSIAQCHLIRLGLANLIGTGLVSLYALQLDVIHLRLVLPGLLDFSVLHLGLLTLGLVHLALVDPGLLHLGLRVPIVPGTLLILLLSLLLSPLLIPLLGLLVSPHLSLLLLGLLLLGLLLVGLLLLGLARGLGLLLLITIAIIAIVVGIILAALIIAMVAIDYTNRRGGVPGISATAPAVEILGGALAARLLGLPLRPFVSSMLVMIGLPIARLLCLFAFTGIVTRDGITLRCPVVGGHLLAAVAIGGGLKVTSAGQVASGIVGTAVHVAFGDHLAATVVDGHKFAARIGITIVRVAHQIGIRLARMIIVVAIAIRRMFNDAHGIVIAAPDIGS